jgi:hypothetical protein
MSSMVENYDFEMELNQLFCQFTDFSISGKRFAPISNISYRKQMYDFILHFTKHVKYIHDTIINKQDLEYMIYVIRY